MEILDVTKIEPRMKHPTIFGKYDGLAEGQALVIHNDHDPKPLYYQLLAERGQTFAWEYLQSGPKIWEVKIKKLDLKNKSQTVGELVASDYRKAEVFRKFGIDFCCGGNQTVEAVCEKNGLNLHEVETALTQVEKQPQNQKQDFNSWDLDFLADYILSTHHQYVNQALPMLSDFSLKVAHVHGQHHPEVIEIASVVKTLRDDFSLHMQKEEQVLFPYIKTLAAAKKSGKPLPYMDFGSVANPIHIMESEHVEHGKNMEQIHLLGSGFTPPPDACSSYRVLYFKLNEFEQDLHQHIHLENNLLFPKAIKLEQELLQSKAG